MPSEEETKALGEPSSDHSINFDDAILLILLGLIFDLFPKEDLYDVSRH